MDLKGKRAINMGFKMDHPGSKKVWDKFFPNNDPAFEDVLNGKNCAKM